jgi:uncharacterized protein (TIGR02757 family)
MRGGCLLQREARMRSVLDRLAAEFDLLGAVREDPVGVVHAVPHPEDRELAAFVAACLAFGSVRAFRPKIREVLEALGPRPTPTVQETTLEALHRRLHRFRYRWIGAADLAGLLAATGALLRRHGSLEAAFAQGLEPEEKDLGPALDRFVASLWAELPESPGPGLRFLLPSPSRGSACKRLCLFLRWVTRPADGVDLGLWSALSPARLVVPLDVHMCRFGRRLGFTRRATPGWSMAQEITRGLRRLAPEDPLRYDFVICHMGISGRCGSRRHPRTCLGCPLGDLCLERSGARGRGEATWARSRAYPAGSSSL